MIIPPIAPSAVASANIPLIEPGAGVAGPSSEGNSFQAVFAEAVERVQSYQATSQATVSQFLDGADIDLHQVALSVQKAETAFELFAEVRNKVVQAYQEIMRLQV